MINTLYRIPAGANGFLYTDHGVALGSGDVTLMFWLRVSGSGTGTQIVLADDGGIGFAIGKSPTTILIQGIGLPVVDTLQRALDEWWHVALVFNNTTGNGELFINGTSVDTANTSSDTLTGIFSLGVQSAEALATIEIVSPAYFDAAFTSAQLTALADASVHYDPTYPSGNWPGATPLLCWSGDFDGTIDIKANWFPGLTPDNGVSNEGDGGSAILSRYRTGITVEPIVTSAVPRIGAIGRYPPIRSFLRTPGTAGSYWKSVGSIIPQKLFLPAGGLGPFSWRFWFRRPASPAVAGGILGQVVGGDSKATVELEPTGEITVTLTDGTTTATETSASPIGAGISWVAVTLTHDPTDELVVVWVGKVPVMTVDVSTLTVPAWTSGGSITVGAGSDGTGYLDIDVIGTSFWDLPLEGDQVTELFDHGGPNHDPRNPTLGDNPTWTPGEDVGDDPIPVEVFVDPVVDGVVPGGEGTGDVLIPFVGATGETEPSTFHAWPSGDHRLGVYSSAWWPESAHDPDEWEFAFAAAAHADVFGECPRVVVVTPREDGALILDLDARMHPGIDYALTAPADLSGEVP